MAAISKRAPPQHLYFSLSKSISAIRAQVSDRKLMYCCPDTVVVRVRSSGRTRCFAMMNAAAKGVNSFLMYVCVCSVHIILTVVGVVMLSLSNYCNVQHAALVFNKHCLCNAPASVLFFQQTTSDRAKLYYWHRLQDQACRAVLSLCCTSLYAIFCH
jgi:hypothetical protein